LLVPAAAPIESAPVTKARRIKDLLVVLIVGFASTAVSNLIFIFGGKRNYSELELNLGLIQGTVTELACLAVLFTILWYRKQASSSIGLRSNKQDFRPGIGLFFGSYAIFIAAYYTLAVLAPSLASDPTYDFNQLGISSPILLTVFLLVNPCFEEVVVRGYFSTELEALTGSKLIAIVIPPLFQGFYHLYQGRIAALSFTAVFMLFSIYFVKTRRLVPVIVAHTVFDLTLIWRLWA
jgi:membrane protease YdiL (CAAX protease family)